MLSFFVLIVLSSLSAQVHFHPIKRHRHHPKPYENHDLPGPRETLPLLDRYRDNIGTATQVWQDGPRYAFDVIHSARDGPLQAEYPDILKTRMENQTCYPSKTHSCGVAINGFGTTGEVHYTFKNSHLNIMGSSIQVMVSCRCLNRNVNKYGRKNECSKCLLMRPVKVCKPASDDPKCRHPDNRTCLYEQDISSSLYSEGMTELLRITRRSRDIGPEYIENGHNFTYDVSSADNRSQWTAAGQRAWMRKCTAAEISSLPTLDPMKVKGSEVGINTHETDPHNNCNPPQGVRYYREESVEKGDACAKLYDYASSAANFRGTQQDDYAMAKHAGTYMDAKPSIVSNTELALSCSAAALGSLCVSVIFRKQLNKKNRSTGYIVGLVLIQFFSYILEALPLHLAMLEEIKAENWIGRFSFLEVTLAVAEDAIKPEGSARGSIMILIGVLGQVGYAKTKYQLIIVLTVLFDSITLAVMLWTICGRCNRLKAAKQMGIATENGSYRKWFWETVSGPDESCGLEGGAFSDDRTKSSGNSSIRDRRGVRIKKRRRTESDESEESISEKGGMIKMKDGEDSVNARGFL